MHARVTVWFDTDDEFVVEEISDVVKKIVPYMADNVTVVSEVFN